MSAPSTIMSEYLILNSVILGIEDFLRVGNRRPWEIFYVPKSEMEVVRASFNARAIRSKGTRTFEASGSIDGKEAVILFFGEAEVPSRLYMK